MFARNTIVVGLLLTGLVLCNVRPADAQALWDLTLDSPDASMAAGTAGTLVFSGVIQNTDPTQTLSLFGDTLTTGNWDATLDVVEDPTFIAFLNRSGTIAQNHSYAGPLFDLSYTTSTPIATAPPYDGSFQIDTDGTPNNLLVPFTLTINGTGAVPEPGMFAPLCALGIAAIRLRRRCCSRRRGN